MMPRATVRCIHGIPTTQCAPCIERMLREPVPQEPFRVDAKGINYLTLRPPHDGRVSVIALRDGAVLTDTCERDLRNIAETEELRSKFKQAVGEAGYLFYPGYSLSIREDDSELGPANCHACRQPVSFENSSAGCSMCRYYACTCGHCLCGYTLTNWQGQVFRQHPPLPISVAVRREYVRAYRFLSGLRGRREPKPRVQRISIEIEWG